MELESWIESFQKELGNSFGIIKERLEANGFDTRTKLKLVFPRELDIMFATSEVPLGAKSLLLYQLEKLREESPLPRQHRGEKTQRSQSMGVEFTPAARKAVLPAFEEQIRKLQDQLEREQDEAREIQIKMDSMAVNVQERPSVGTSRTICSNCHTRGHRNQQSKPCLLAKCTDFALCGIKEKHSEYFSRLNAFKSELKKKTNTINELQSQLKSMNDFSSNSEFTFIKNLTPRLFDLDQSYKLNKPKLMRDIRMLRKCLDGKIPPVTANDAEQLGILIAKCKKNLNLDLDAPNIQEKNEKSFTDYSPVKFSDSAVNSKVYVTSNEATTTRSSSSSDNSHSKKSKKAKKKQKRKTKKRRLQKKHSSSDSTSSSDDGHTNKHQFPAYIPQQPPMFPQPAGMYTYANPYVPPLWQNVNTNTSTPVYSYTNVMQPFQHQDRRMFQQETLPVNTTHRRVSATNQKVTFSEEQIPPEQAWSGLDALANAAYNVDKNQ